jgi:hypothetical protein
VRRSRGSLGRSVPAVVGTARVRATGVVRSAGRATAGVGARSVHDAPPTPAEAVPSSA